MKNAWKLIFILTLAAPAYAQEEAPAEDAVADEATSEAPAEESAPIETTPVEEAAAAEEPLDTVPVGEEDAPAEEVDPWRLYAGVDLARTTLSVSNLSGFQTRNYDSGIYRLRLGARLLDQVSVEFHYGLDAGDEGPGEASTKNYYGLFAVPTAHMFDVVELAFPVGYAMSSVERPGASADLSSIAYGINAELPLRTFGEDWPDLRFGLGWMIYYQKSDARLYGANLGLRYDFAMAGFNFGNPFAGLDLWPFGDDEEEAVEE